MAIGSVEASPSAPSGIRYLTRHGRDLRVAQLEERGLVAVHARRIGRGDALDAPPSRGKERNSAPSVTTSAGKVKVVPGGAVALTSTTNRSPSATSVFEAVAFALTPPVAALGAGGRSGTLCARAEARVAAQARAKAPHEENRWANHRRRSRDLKNARKGRS